MHQPGRVRHDTVCRDPFLYSAHPQAVIAADGSWLAVFNQAPRRKIVLHPPQDPLFRNVLVRSGDEGDTWSVPITVPDYEWAGVECAGLTVTATGRILLQQWRFRWEPLLPGEPPPPGTLGPETFARHLALSKNIVTPEDILQQAGTLFPWTRANHGSFVHSSDDGGRTWSLTSEVPGGGYGMRGAVQCADGRLILPFCDIPGYRHIGISESTDDGATWTRARTIAGDARTGFAEPAPLLTESGRFLMLLRDDATGDLYQIASDDDGTTWSTPELTPIPGFPAHLLNLGDGRILCTYGVRRPPYTIEAVTSDDDGRTWNIDGRTIIRGGLPDRDLGYPVTLKRSDGTLCTLYYCRDEQGVTGIEQSIWTV